MNTEIICFSSGKANENLTECEKQLCTLLCQLEVDAPERTQCNAEEKQLISAFKEAAANNHIVFLCGDIEISKALISKVYRLKSALSEEYRNLLIGRAAQFEETALLFPAGSRVAFCRETADSAFIIKASGKVIFALPSNPASLKAIIDDCIIPYFAEEKGKELSRVNIKLFDVNDRQLSSVTKALKSKYPVKILTYSHCGKTELEISSCAKTREQADNACYAVIGDLKNAFGDSIYEVGQKSLAEVTVEALKRSGMRISTAESCTGGMLSGAITSVPGASEVLEIGICAYSNRVKRDALAVSEELLNTYGAVSKETAAALAKGSHTISGSHLGVGITGVAGPQPSEGKAVGTVYVAIHDGKNYWVRLLTLPENSNRDEIRERATATALDLIRRYLLCLPAVLSGACKEDSLKILYAQPGLGFTDTIDRQAGSEPEAPEEVQTDFSKINAPVPEIEVPASVAVDTESAFADFIHDDYGTENNSSDDSPEIAAENYNDDSGIIMDDDYEAPLMKEKKKKTSKSSKGIKIAFTAVIALLLVAAVIFGNYFFKIYRDLSQIDSAREIYSSLSKEEAFARLDGENSDFTGWLSIGDTKVNNPVYQTGDNSFYATHNMNKQKSRYGALFFDYRNTVDGNGKSKNIVVYGQNMNDGAMFGTLGSYQALSFLTANSEITLSTAQSDETYKIYAVIITNADKEDDEGHFFDFSRPEFNSQSVFDSWATELKAKNLYITDLQISFGDSFLTLVTTSDAFDNARLVVIAKKSAAGDSSATYAVNPSPVYPKAWYEERNLKPDSGSVMTSTDAVSNTSSDQSSSEASSSEESSSQAGASSSPASSRPTTSTPTSSASGSSEQSSSEQSGSESDSSTPESSETSSETEGNEDTGSQGNESENTTTE